MRRSALLLSVALVVAAVAMVPIGGLAAGGGADVAQQTTTEEQPQNETADDVSPGERLSGVVAVGQSELENEVDSRAFGLRVAGAATENATADVVKEQLDDVEQRIEHIEERKHELDRARENGSMSEGAYQAQVADVAAELEGAERLANQSENASAGLPADLLAEKGIDVEAIRTLAERANELGGQEVAEIARSIAGPSVGMAPGHAGPGDRGPADRGSDTPRHGNGTDAGQPDVADRDDDGNQTDADEPTETPEAGADGRP